MDQYIGKLLDNRYEILEVVGTGGMSVVYKARCRVLNRFVAIKILKEEFAQDEEFRRRFYMESQAVAKLSHNNIVSVYDVSHTPGLEYIVMELMEGITLKEYLQKKGHLSWQEALFFAQQIARALSHAHSRGIIHQDIKPQNILILRDGTAKVTDFGIASFAATSQETRVVQEAIGSVHYISPEQAKGSTIDFRTDIYSLGVVMYEMLTGKLPFEGDNALAIVMQHISAMPLLPSEVVPGIPRGMDDIVMHAMCPTASRRYASAEELYNDLQKLKNDPNVTFQYDGESIRGEAPSLDETQALPNYADIRHAASAAPAQPQKQHARYQPVREEPEGYAPRPQRKKKGFFSSPVAVATTAVVAFVIFAVIVGWLMVSSGSSGKVEVPNLVGRNISDTTLAEYVDLSDDAYRNFKFKTKTVQDENGVDGEILKQDPSAGEKVAEGATITLTVCSAGNAKEDEEYTVEKFENYTYDEVKELLKDTGVIVRRGPDETSDTVEKDKVIRTEPAEGTKLKRGETLTVIVSSGKDENAMGVMINVVGAPKDDAVKALDALEIKSEIHIVASDKTKDLVVSQSVDAGETVSKDKTVILEVSSGVAAPETGGDEPTDGGGGEQKPDDGGGSTTPAPQKGSATIDVAIPAAERESARIVVKQSDGTVLYDSTLTGAGESQSITLEGSGTQMLTVTVNGGYTSNQEVTFK
ncbi:Stk1 family PASTA domain-containing Ser/Thr kinase [Intestinibacillus massiliensis]|nr:Stk1 family PASTA domain-containing Ser/Thr kinase [Intestinibacillus massiliensis]